MFFLNANAETVNKKYHKNEKGILGLMYHRFDENKYPSTNIRMDIFKKHIEIIKEKRIDFISPKEFSQKFYLPKNKKKVLLTIDDAFTSFYENAWPYLKKNNIPFILFVSTEAVGKNGYMTWDQILEIEKENIGFIGNHSHSHNYLIEDDLETFKQDIQKSIKIFNYKLGYNPIFFSYPFGEYSLEQENFISENFQFSFGQHSGVIDINKEKFELPRFPINEKYGDLERFKNLVNYLPLQYKLMKPKNKLLSKNNNPPKMLIEFFEEQEKIENINCYSNEEGKWQKSKTQIEKNILFVNFRKKFDFRRGRINCSLKDIEGWRFVGFQFSNKLD